MKRLKLLIFIVSCMFTMTTIVEPLEFIYADCLMYVNSDYSSNNKNSGLDYLNLYIKDIHGEVSNVSANIDGIECNVSCYDLNSNNIPNNVYFLISISNFSDTIEQEQIDRVNSKVQDVLKYLLKNKNSNSNYSFQNSLLSNDSTIDISTAKDVENIDFTIGNCALNSKLDDILNDIKSKNTPSKIVLISDGTNDANPSITSNYIVQELKSIPCEIIPVEVEPLSSVTNQEDINLYNMTDATSFKLDELSINTLKKPLIEQINDWSNIKIFQVDLNSFEKDGQSKILKLSFTDSDGSNSITFPFELPSTSSTISNNDNDDITLNKKAIVIIVLSLIIIVLIVAIVIISVKKSNKSTSNSTIDTPRNFNTNQKSIEDIKLPDSFTIILNDMEMLGRYFQINIAPNSRTIIGKSPQKCDLIIDYEPSVSRQHCKIFFENGTVYIEDLNSSYHTYVNKHRIDSPTKINDGDIISLG
ncbi:MAG: FHA domain-containing protein, partial [Ruminococcus sp.]|nr:FHA domain-containing protein [Ruminococcus sp.]